MVDIKVMLFQMWIVMAPPDRSLTGKTLHPDKP